MALRGPSGFPSGTKLGPLPTPLHPANRRIDLESTSTTTQLVRRQRNTRLRPARYEACWCCHPHGSRWPTDFAMKTPFHPLSITTAQTRANSDTPEPNMDCADHQPSARPFQLKAFGPSPVRLHRRPKDSDPQEDPRQTGYSPTRSPRDTSPALASTAKQTPPDRHRSIETTGLAARLQLPLGNLHHSHSPHRVSQTDLSPAPAPAAKQTPPHRHRNVETAEPT